MKWNCVPQVDCVNIQTDESTVWELRYEMDVHSFSARIEVLFCRSVRIVHLENIHAFWRTKFNGTRYLIREHTHMYWTNTVFWSTTPTWNPSKWTLKLCEWSRAQMQSTWNGKKWKWPELFRHIVWMIYDGILEKSQNTKFRDGN